MEIVYDFHIFFYFIVIYESLDMTGFHKYYKNKLKKILKNFQKSVDK